MTTTPLLEGRRADTGRRRQRVLKAINDAKRSGEELTVAGIARRAAVDRTFLYRHPDLLTQVHIAQAEPTNATSGSPAVSRASLAADLANAQERNNRLNDRVRQLETKLSQALGEQVWRESGLGAPDDIEQLKLKIIQLEQALVDRNKQLDECRAELDAARAANRQLMTQLNSRHT